MITKQELKEMLIEIRNGNFITPALEKIWNTIDKLQKDNIQLSKNKTK